MLNDEFLPSSNKNKPSSSAQEEELVVVVIVHLDFHFGSKLLSNYYKNISKFKLNSNIIINNNIYLSNEIIYHTKHSQSVSPPQLLYRGSRDGFKGIDFHSKCDNKGPTLTIIKSSTPYNQIFGGFTTQSWKSSRSEYISDDSAFVFKIVDENKFRKFNIKQNRIQHAIYVHPSCLPIFGSGGDIFIYSDCNLNNNSNSYFGDSYELPRLLLSNEFKYDSEKANNYLAGTHKFKVLEIEVFKIITTTTTTTSIQ